MIDNQWWTLLILWLITVVYYVWIYRMLFTASVAPWRNCWPVFTCLDTVNCNTIKLYMLLISAQQGRFVASRQTLGIRFARAAARRHRTRTVRQVPGEGVQRRESEVSERWRLALPEILLTNHACFSIRPDSGSPCKRWRLCRSRRSRRRWTASGASSSVRTPPVRWTWTPSRLIWRARRCMRRAHRTAGASMWPPRTCTIWWRATRTRATCARTCTRTLWTARGRRSSPFRICSAWSVEWGGGVGADATTVRHRLVGEGVRVWAGWCKAWRGERQCYVIFVSANYQIGITSISVW